MVEVREGPGFFVIRDKEKAPKTVVSCKAATVLGGFQERIPIPMVVALAPTVKAYVAGVRDSSGVARQRCPLCGVLCWRHGRYQRGVVDRSSERRIAVYRQRCPKCGKTFGVLPAFVRPWTVVTTLVREAAARSHYARGRPLSVLMEEFADVASPRTVVRWLGEVRSRSAAVLAPISEAILDLYPGVDPSGLLPAGTTAAAAVIGLLRLGEHYRRLSWGRQSDRREWTVGLFGLCNARAWASSWL